MKKRKLLLRSKRPLPRRLKLSPLRRRRRDLRLPFPPRRLTALVSMVLPELKSNPLEVEEVAVEVVVAREAAAVVTEVAVEATEEVAEERDVDLDLKAKSLREDPDQKVDSVEAEAKELKVPKVKNAQDLRVDSAVAEVKELKVPRVRSVKDPKVDSAVAEAKELKVLKVKIAQEPKVAEAEDPPELRVREPLLKVKSLSSVPEERELSVMVNTASRERRESSIIPSTERTELAEAEVSLRAVLVRATGELPKRK